ncbi:MAG TPA: hypothetical protein VE442_01130 [Jatrophihabitans sp.]|nr:hypothetical protein [Jatrophihabitans sp.]
MRQVRITKLRRSAERTLEPLPLDPRDPDIVRTKRLARTPTRRALTSQAIRSRP